MIKKILKNGLTIILEKRNSNSVVIEISVRIGSNNEPERILGVSHFIEHLIFNGTRTRSSRQIAQAIESVGGEINAITGNERTSFYVKVPYKYFDIGLDVLSDCIKNSKFEKEEIEKERNIIISEMDINKDSPMTYTWFLFPNKLFKKINAKNPVIGTKETLKSIKREDILEYYNNNYVLKNLIVAVTGNFKSDILKKIYYKFKDFNKNDPVIARFIKEPEQHMIEEFTERRSSDHSYIMIGYKVPSRLSDDSYALDIIRIILGTGFSSRLFDEIRNKRGLGYAAISFYEANRDYGYFVSFVTTDKEKLEECRKIIVDQYRLIKDVSDKEVDDAKKFIEGQFMLESEDTLKYADMISSWEIIKDAKLADSYIKKIKNVSSKDIKRVASKYFHENYCTLIITN